MKKIIKVSLIIVSLVTCSAFAVTTPLQTTANLNSSCALSANNLVFGTLSLATSSGNNMSSFPNAIQLKCSKGISFKLTLSSPSQVINTRYMTGADASNTTRLAYSLFFDRSQDYGNEDTNSIEYSNIATGATLNYKLTGDININSIRAVKPDIYTENLTLVVTY